MNYEQQALSVIEENESLKNHITPFLRAAKKMIEFEHNKPPIVHYDDWIALLCITEEEQQFELLILERNNFEKEVFELKTRVKDQEEVIESYRILTEELQGRIRVNKVTNA